MEKCESIYLIDSHLCESRRESRLAWYGNPYANKGAMHRNFYFCIKKFCVEFILDHLLHKNNYIPRKQIFALNQILIEPALKIPMLYEDIIVKNLYKSGNLHMIQ